MSEIQGEEERKFVMGFLEAVDPKCDGSPLLAFIQRSLRQFHLDSLYDEDSVLHEVFLRGLKSVRNGKDIDNMQPWIKGAALNVIRELSRQEKKTVSLDIQNFDFLESASVPSLDSYESDFWLVRRALDFLLPEDQEILRLVFLENLSYQEIQKHLLGEGRDISMSSLRKRKERALKRLRETYFSQKRLQQDL